MITIPREVQQTGDGQADEQFLAMVPDIERFTRFQFRHLSVNAREDAVCEVVANAFCAFRRLVELGKQNLAYSTPLAHYAVAQFRAGRRVGNPLNSCDVYSIGSQRRARFRLESLDSRTGSEIWEEALIDNTQTPVPDQVAFRIDFPAWLQTLQQPKGRLAKYLAYGHSPSEVACRFGVSRGRVSQVRRELERSWNEYQSHM